MPFTHQRHLKCSYDEALARLPEALKAEGFGVLTEIDVKQTLAQKLGVDFRKYKILGACNPALAYEALSATLDVGVMLPCNVVVYETEGGRAMVHAIDPTATVAADPRLGKLSEVVSEKLARVLDRLV